MSAVCIVLGILIIASRAPLVFAPQATLLFYRQMVATNGRVRALGVVVAGLGLAMLISGRNSDAGAELALFWFGVFMSAVAGGLLLILPGAYRTMAAGVLDFMGDPESADLAVTRVAGVFGVAVGGFFVYLGARVV
ncbi:MAG: hypothetical protein GY725_24390 [bacterium]|nr:hypothetical protein [bacterium]